MQRESGQKKKSRKVYSRRSTKNEKKTQARKSQRSTKTEKKNRTRKPRHSKNKKTEKKYNNIKSFGRQRDKLHEVARFLQGDKNIHVIPGISQRIDNSTWNNESKTLIQLQKQARSLGIPFGGMSKFQLMKKIERYAGN